MEIILYICPDSQRIHDPYIKVLEITKANIQLYFQDVWFKM